MLCLRNGVRSPTLHPSNFFTREAFAEDIFAHQILMGAVHIGLRFDLMPKVTQHLHAPLIGDMRTRRICQPAITVDHHVLNAVR